MRPDELERRLRERLEALGPAPGAELLHVLMLPDFELDPSGRTAPQTRRSPRRSPGGSPSPSSAVRDGHPQPVITAVIPPGPVSKRSNETDSITTTWLPGQVSVERGVTVKLPVV